MSATTLERARAILIQFTDLLLARLERVGPDAHHAEEIGQVIAAGAIWEIAVHGRHPAERDALRRYAAEVAATFLGVPPAAIEAAAAPARVLVGPDGKPAAPPTCRNCGCHDFARCDDAGQPCTWVEPDLCSRCTA